MINVIRPTETAPQGTAADPLTSSKTLVLLNGRKLFAKMLLVASVGIAVVPTSAASALVPETTKPLIVLVHGAFADASGWKRVVPLLQKDGYRVLAVDNSLKSFSADVAATERAIASQRGPVVAVGHSYGGAVITQAAANHSNVIALVYIAAFAPASGEAIGQFLEKYPSDLGAALKTSETGFVTLHRTKFRELFAADVSVEDANVMAIQQRPIVGTAFGSKITRAAWAKVPSWYMVATEDRAINPELQRFYGRRMKATTVEVSSSHVPFLSHPHQVAALIKKAAEAKAK